MNYSSNDLKISDEEFNDLFRQYKETGNISVRNKIVLAYGYIPQTCAMQLRGIASSYAQIEDMINQGMITLIDCVDKFDPDKRVKFESYAFLRVKGGIIDLVRKQDWIPRRVRVTAREINDVRSVLYSELGREPTHEEVAERMGVSPEKLRQYNAEISNSVVFSFEELIQNVSQMSSILESSTKDDITPEKKILKDELRLVLREAIDELSERERLVVTLYFYEGLNLSDISKVLDVTVQRVSQINARAVSKLKQKLNEYIIN